MDFAFLTKYGGFFITGLKFTLLLSITSAFFGLIIGSVLAFMKMSKSKILKLLSTAYIEFIRGTPLLVQLYIIYLTFPIDLNKVNAGIVALAINSAAYVAEIIRSGIEGIDDGQMEASRSLGMNKFMSMRYIIAPQGLKNVLPVLGNEFIAIIKESSLISVIGVTELMYNTTNVRTIIYRDVEPLAIAALLYFIVTFTISKLLVRLERRLNVSDKSK